VKKYLAHIYGKLDVRTRTAALANAGLVKPPVAMTV
jgi:DNA-binding CsgD family transcriptional regulator